MTRFAPAMAALILSSLAIAAPLPWPFNMTVARCEKTPQGYVVETTGATFELLPGRGVVRLAQKIAAKRSLGEVSLGMQAMSGLRLISSDEEKVSFTTGGGLRLEISCDSVLRLDASADTPTSIAGMFNPEQWTVQPGATVALDDVGGLGAYFLERGATRAQTARTDRGFTIRDVLPAGQTFLLSVCPPRPYDWRAHHDERIVHFFPALNEKGIAPRPLPTDDELVQWRKIASVLVIHLEAWDGFGVQHIKPRDPARFREVIAKAHALGFLVLPYSSCFYYTPARAGEDNYRVLYKDNAVDLYIEEAAWLLKEYDVDGLYWDGSFTDPLKAWDAARRMRKLLGSRKLYIHCTWDPLPYPAICPFADTYADYLLRGEAQDRRRVDPMYLRYIASGYNVSNAVGDLCYDTARVDKQMVDWALQANARIPYWPGSQVMAGKSYFLSPEEDKLFRDYYVPLADKVKGPADYAKYAAAGREVRAARVAESTRRREANEAALGKYLADRKAAMATQTADNLAAFRPVTCSDYASYIVDQPHGLGYRPEYATDANPDTIWGADYTPQWVAVDLGKPQTISSVRVVNYFADKRFYHYRVEVSADGKTWAKVAEKLDDAVSTREGTLHAFAACEVRWVRVVMLSNSANCGVHVAELEVYR